jgi:MSHA biogenesis protein MshQ
MSRWQGAWLAAALGLLPGAAGAVTVQFNSSGGTTATDGLHFYIDDSTKIQVRRLNDTGQVFEANRIPPHTRLDNGIFIRANGRVYGPSHNVGGGFTPNGGMYNTYSIGAVSPAGPSSPGVQQSVAGNFGITSGPQVSIVWKYTTPLDFLTAEVTLTIPTGFAVSATNPVRYYHVVDTYLGGSDNGCGVSLVDNGKRLVGTYPPAGASCPSNTSIPSGVSVVESFRERSGQNFSAYCAAVYSSFWNNVSPNCSVSQSSAMSNTVTTAYQDTGIGIEYDFTASGTYTFSYDFVVGSTVVPPYDHLEIRHDGAATLCPENVTVLACTSTTVPCPAANLVNTGTLTANLTVTPATPAVTVTPATFSLGAAGTTATVVLQGTSPGDTYTLGTSNPSAVPLSGTRCWNTATSSASCSFVVSNSSCVSSFECIETGVAYNNLTAAPSTRNPLYTRLAGTNFKFDVVALQSGGGQASGYAAAANVTVELFDDSASPQPACSAYTTPIASQAITFAAADNGRKTLATALNVARAYRKVRCRVTDANFSPSVVGCSSDDFAIRPQSFTSVSSNMNADASGASTTATPSLKTGANFTMTASTGVVGYTGTPTIDATKIEAHGGAVATGSVSGSFAAAASATGSSIGNAFGYSEVGYFRFMTNGVVDPDFTSVDQPNDCIGSGTDEFSNAIVSGKYGCKFGNTATTSYFGRFIPDHFDETLTHGCAAGTFTYSGQPFTLGLTARNSTGATTQNYSGSFAKAVTLSDANAVTGGGLAPTNLPAGSFAGGVASPTPAFTFARTTPDHAPASIKPRAMDAESVSSATGTEATTLIRIGRLRLVNAYGGSSALAIPVEAQYWSGSSWLLNTADSCTTIPATSVALSNYLDGKGAAAAWTTTAGGTALAGGRGSIALTAPNPAGSTGSVDLAINLGTGTTDVSCLASHPVMAAPAASLAWLRGRNGNCAASNTYSADPSARATFGIYPAENRKAVHVREMF